MEPSEADPDTRVDVDLMILDYLLCITLETLLCTGQTPSTEPEEDCDSSICAVNALKCLIPEDLIPDEIRTKLRVFELADAIHRHSPPSDILTKFVFLCAITHPRCPWTRIAGQLIAQGAMADGEASLQDSLSRHVASMEKALQLGRVGGSTASRIKSHIEPSAGTSLDAHIQHLAIKLAPDALRQALFDVLLEIMKIQEPPILLQLERGKLHGLSRAETQELKDRVGFR
ncbi:hypothetical protein BDV59DRAFT_17646 [Aspergillus ambiguus]|uniref:uncharacterized protein n=1 Tax=Aspergillus ambiguus TaxID=176160 RepID=UPI003CCCEC1D